MKKDFIATQKYLIMSPRKIRLVAAIIKKMKPVDAVLELPFVQKRAAEPVMKVVKNAIASAKNQGVADTDLIFKEIQIGEGPRLKRGQAASRGRWHAFKHRMAHIRVVLTTKEVVKKGEKKDPETSSGQKKNGTKS
ncbi:MAG TPA: uL22 family ribosomal protein [Alphaproteobacteria bacterium]|jgi:large subunit ribosomal protein L22|nr:uL22 family ribosomal protein [Alphaproteobacteria bacterium]